MTKKINTADILFVHSAELEVKIGEKIGPQCIMG